MKPYWWPAFKVWIVKDRLLITVLVALIVIVWSVRLNFEFYKGVYGYFANQDKVAVRLDSIAIRDTVSFVHGYEAGLERAAALATLESQKGFAWDVVSIYWYDSTDQFAESNTATGKRVTITKAGNFYGDTTENHLAIGIYDNKKGKVRY